MSIEANERKCKVCGETKARILIGRYDDSNKKYVDLTGKVWNGSCCPACHVKTVKEKMKALREKKAQEKLLDLTNEELPSETPKTES